jgi:hypothetical protein
VIQPLFRIALASLLVVTGLAGHPARAASRVSDRGARIAIVGGGVSGLSAALWLKQKGYRDITLFEKEADLGGKVHSYVHPATGQVYEIGAIIQSASFKSIYEVARLTGYAGDPKEWLRPFTQTAIAVDSDGNEVAPFLTYLPPRDPGQSMSDRYSRAEELAALPRFARLLSRLGPYWKIYAPGFDGISGSPRFRELLEPMGHFMTRHGMGSILGPFSLFFNMTGYGFTSEVPALYHAKFLRMVSRAGAKLALHLDAMTTATRGYQELFRHVGAHLRKDGVKLRLETQVLGVSRPAAAAWGNSLAGRRDVRIRYLEAGAPQAQEERFDVLIVATPPDAARKYLDLAPAEQPFFSEVRYYNFATTLFEDRSGSLRKWKNSVVLVEDYALKPAVTVPGSHVTGLYNHDGSDVFTAYSFARTPAEKWVTDDEIQAQLLVDLKRLGADVRKESLLLTRQWRNYFPHFSSQTLKSNPEGGAPDASFIPRMLALQGRSATLYLMATFDFESTEHLATYSRSVIDRHFRGKLAH